jgi:class 3 adenylate cyclase
VEPEEAMETVRDYHRVVGKLIFDYGATIDHRAGDGVMVYFNDPLPCERPGLAAIQLAMEMRRQLEELGRKWSRLEHELGFGVGISLGFATLGMVGYEGRYDYTANGTVVNVAARLCQEARAGQILITKRLYAEVEETVDAEPAGLFTLKGLVRPVEAFAVRSVKDTR